MVRPGSTAIKMRTGKIKMQIILLLMENSRKHWQKQLIPQKDYIIPDSDSRYITDEDLTGLSDYEILLARNEIYARHGRIFVNEDLNSYFRSKSWYQPAVSGEDFTEEYAASVFNEYERANIDTIVKYEQAHNINQM